MLNHIKKYKNRYMHFCICCFVILFILIVIVINLNNSSNLKNIYSNKHFNQIYFSNISINKPKQEKRKIVNSLMQYIKNNITLESVYLIHNTAEKQEESKEKREQKNVSNINIYKTNKWRIQIPKLKLDAPISEGTSQEALRRTVGHFEQSGKWNGNVALAGHNRGYRCNYFQEIKKLKKGDKIIYLTENRRKVYKVILNKIIKDTNWDYIKQTKDNRITLITCEENMREYRRCIQAIEVK